MGPEHALSPFRPTLKISDSSDLWLQRYSHIPKIRTAGHHRTARTERHTHAIHPTCRKNATLFHRGLSAVTPLGWKAHCGLKSAVNVCIVYITRTSFRDHLSSLVQFFVHILKSVWLTKCVTEVKLALFWVQTSWQQLLINGEHIGSIWHCE